MIGRITQYFQKPEPVYFFSILDCGDSLGMYLALRYWHLKRWHALFDRPGEYNYEDA